MKPTRRIFSAILLVAILVLTASLLIWMQTRQTKISNDADFSVTLERTACFGFCPIYRITVDGDGNVTYYGDMFVAVEGERTSRITQDQVRRLARELESVDFFSLEDNYTDMGATDMPSAITTLQVNGKTKTIEHYHGDFSAPKKLTRLENLIDTITNSEQWVEPAAP